MSQKGVLDQIKEGLAVGSQIKPLKSKKYSNIVLSGVENSGLIKKVLHDLVGNEINIVEETDFFVSELNKKSLAVIISYSGVTREIVNFYKKASRITKNIIIITSGSYLQKIAVKKKYPLVSLPANRHARNSFYLMLFGTIAALNKRGATNISKKEINETIKNIKNFSKNFKTIKYSEELLNKIPAIYNWDEFTSLNAGIKRLFNLNSKKFVINNLLPESDYENIEAIGTGDKKVKPLFIIPSGKDFTDARNIMKSFELSSKEKCLNYEMTGKSKLSQIITTLMFFEIVTKNIAEELKVDANSRNFVELLKTRIKKIIS